MTTDLYSLCRTITTRSVAEALSSQARFSQNGQRMNAFWRKSTDMNVLLTRDGRWYDTVTATGGDALDLVQLVLGCDRKAGIQWLAQFAGIDKVQPATALSMKAIAEAREWRSWKIYSGECQLEDLDDLKTAAIELLDEALLDAAPVTYTWICRRQRAIQLGIQYLQQASTDRLVELYAKERRKNPENIRTAKAWFKQTKGSRGWVGKPVLLANGHRVLEPVSLGAY